MDMPGATPRARALRQRMGHVETYLWKQLRDRRFEGLKFRRQVPIGPYVADFVSFPARLIVEVDGGVHRLREDRDRQRDVWLTGQGFTVLRFPNQSVLNSPMTVFAAIAKVARAAGLPLTRPGEPGHPLPQGERAHCKRAADL